MRTGGDNSSTHASFVVIDDGVNPRPVSAVAPFSNACLMLMPTEFDTSLVSRFAPAPVSRSIIFRLLKVSDCPATFEVEPS